MCPYHLWIEAEAWAVGRWDPRDTNADVIVTLADGSRWGASFVSYANVATLVTQWKRTGECLHGTYVWARDMILIDTVSRPQIEKVVAHLLETGDFKAVFSQLEEDYEGYRTGTGKDTHTVP